jgi:hypothetical protein
MRTVILTEAFILDLKNFSLDAFALPRVSLDSIAHLKVLDDHVLVLDGLSECLIIQDVPLILIREVVLHALHHLLPIGSWTLLEGLHLLKSRVHLIDLQATDWHEEVEEAAPEEVVLPTVNTLPEEVMAFLLAFGFCATRIKELLRDSYNFALIRL